MSRLAAAVRLDLRLQARYGFYYAAAFVTLVWVACLRLLPDWSLALAAPFVVFADLAVVGFYFIAALVLYERGQATLTALAVTPLRFWEYLAARLATLTLLALVASLVVVLASVGTAFDPIWLVLGVLLTSLLASLTGFITVAPFTSVSSYLIPSALPLIILGLPVVALAGWETPLLYLLPTQGALLLLRGALTSVAPWQVVYALVSGLLWLALLGWGARWAFDRFILARRGGR